MARITLSCEDQGASLVLTTDFILHSHFLHFYIVNIFLSEVNVLHK